MLSMGSKTTARQNDVDSSMSTRQTKPPRAAAGAMMEDFHLFLELKQARGQALHRCQADSNTHTDIHTLTITNTHSSLNHTHKTEGRDT